MLEIQCKGSPYEIGTAHGQAASLHIQRTIKFYTRTFHENTGLSWPAVESVGQKFLPLLSKHPALLEEMQGVADSSGATISSIIALNVRTEITYGLMKDDGCTTLAWKIGGHGEGKSFLGQNWDWQTEQKQNLVVLSISPILGPRIKMVTEAGIIGKIGLNSSGVGVCLNAIRAWGMDPTRMPVHLGLRLCLNSESREEAVGKLKDVGIAAACTIVCADGTGGVAMECSHLGLKQLEMDAQGRVFHSNHFLVKPDEGVLDKQEPKDTLERIKRIEVLADELIAKGGEKGLESASVKKIAELFKDEKGLPMAICRAARDDSTVVTLFNIVSDLTEKTAMVTLGRPSEPEEKFWLNFKS